MKLSTVEPPPSSGDSGTANDRFRGGDRRRLFGSVALSVAIHALLVLAWPELSPSALDPGFSSGATALELVTVAPDRPPGEGLVALPLVPEEEEESPPDGAEEEASEGEDDGDAGSAATRGDGRAEALERIASVTPGVLRRRPDPPTETAPEEVTDVERTDAEEADGADVRLRAATSRLYGRLSEEELLRLERLSSIRPELAFGSTSSWLVLQNPSAVKDYMRRRYGSGRGTPAHGRLSVSLWVDERGSVEWAEINRSSGRPDLDEAALELFETVVRFTPARNQGMGVPTAAVFWLQW